jgi:hypothetical protein
VVGRPANPCALLTYGSAPHGLCVTNIPILTLSLVEFQMFLLFVEMLQFGYVSEIEWTLKSWN